ncbi:MAG: TlyA family RNA methyltransferase [Verrucomicrobiota bacterium]|jgi:23S rRNA (cytidine1920-2'-O)/16S rRNA (cytidine1409-2'-O)-methyltransferase|nr:TlyA family RNA methyltransferase [Verrucomicrobiota bacterium]MDD8049914.1 TlyA family RNA methyltransferase [Verrucomicrobiota bacterium]HCF93564.1 TlyA family rRNA (cytidine-2'-O)-methyltransferase [Verrucomicrobiota bacterium]
MALQKDRLDRVLVARGLADSREQAQRLVLAGAVRINDHRADKPGRVVPVDVPLEVIYGPRFVSRGGEKLDAALAHWPVPVEGTVCIDLGASTGGFTDCLLQRGATRVYAIDVGYGQLDWKLRQDPRVVVMERVNARHLEPSDLPEPAGLMTADLSFISLEYVLVAGLRLLQRPCWMVVLIKPQFEAGREKVGKGGVVRDPLVHQEVVDRVNGFVLGVLGAAWSDVIPSPLLGPAGNREFLLAARWDGSD